MIKIIIKGDILSNILFSLLSNTRTFISIAAYFDHSFPSGVNVFIKYIYIKNFLKFFKFLSSLGNISCLPFSTIINLG